MIEVSTLCDGSAQGLQVTTSAAIATVEIDRPPHNSTSLPMLTSLADAFERIDADPDCRAIVLCSAGRSFCAGAELNGASRPQPKMIYAQALRLFRVRKPVIAAVQGAAIGAGLGLAMMADFRVASPEARFSGNFTRLGIHPGFGLSLTLPRIVGPQHAALLLYTSRRIDGEAAARIGLIDLLVKPEELRASAIALATEIASAAPLAVQATRTTLRAEMLSALEAQIAVEVAEQERLMLTDDYKEGVRASAERRPPIFWTK